jgi:hypothetical protein
MANSWLERFVYATALKSLVDSDREFAVKTVTEFARRFVLDGQEVVRWARSPLEILWGMAPSAWTPRIVLNEAPRAWREPASPDSLGKRLQSMRHLLESDAIVDGRVDYRGLRKSPLYAEFEEYALLLRHIYPVEFESDAERIAFWINLYNVVCIHGVIALGLQRSSMEMPSFFARVAYRVGEWTFTPNDMLNGVLRRGRRRPDGMARQFRAGDPRLAYSPSTVDPRMHGALVCLARSCPPVAHYSADKLDAQLEAAANHLIAGSVVADVERRELQLPLQLYYYYEDFVDDAGVERFVLHHVGEEQRPAVERAFRERWRIRWQPYDWAFNSADGAEVSAEQRASSPVATRAGLPSAENS